jgi:hypothetical protein
MPLWTLLLACPAPETDTDGAACPSVQAPETVEIAEAVFGYPSAATVVIGNTCGEGDPLEVSGVLYGDPGLALEGGEGSAVPGGETTLSVLFTAQSYADADGTIVLTTNDPARPELAISVHATVDSDQDGDGFPASEAGGVDCDDTRANVHPAAMEDRDGVDEDCDGVADEGLVAPGDVWIAEIQVDPAVTADADGEWIELFNASAFPVALTGWQLADAAGHVVVLEEAPVVPAGGRVVLGAREDANNGGAPVAWAWGAGALDLAQPAGGLTLSFQGVAISAVAWDESWGIDPGASWGLDPLLGSAERVSDGRWWCPQTAPYGVGDRGTPGAENEPCRTVDHDGDGESEADGDCDDADPAVHEGAVEVENGVDDDCDDLVDEA